MASSGRRSVRFSQDEKTKSKPMPKRNNYDPFVRRGVADTNDEQFIHIPSSSTPRNNAMMTPYSGIIQKYINENKCAKEENRHQKRRRDMDPIFGTSSIVDAELLNYRQQQLYGDVDSVETDESSISSISEIDEEIFKKRALKIWKRHKEPIQRILRLSLILLTAICSKTIYQKHVHPWMQNKKDNVNDPTLSARPHFVYEHPYVTSSYYTATSNTKVLEKMKELQVDAKKDRPPDRERGIVSRLAILRPFCEFDAEALPTTFACWNSLVPCRAAEMDLGDEDDEDNIDEWVLFDMSVDGTGRKLKKGEEDQWECEADYSNNNNEDNHPTSWFRGIANAANSLFKRCKRKPKAREYFDQVPADGLRTTSADLFLFYSQTFSENDEAIKAVDEIMEEFYSPGGWSRCFDNIYAVEANIPKQLDLYIPAAQEELYSWVNGPNRQYEAGFRIIQSGEWGDYDPGFYLMEGDSVPVKNYWLDVILGEINAYRPFAVLGAQYDGDKWDQFYESIPISLLHHTNGNGIYNTSHPLLERLTGQLEVEAPCPYNSIPYDYRMSQMWVEGTLGIVPKLATKIMLNEEGVNITLSDNVAMFSKWANKWNDEEPYKFTKAIHNYAATNIVPRHLGPEYVIHGAKLYSPWDPARTDITLVISEWFFDRSLNLIKNLDSKDHPFSRVIIMIPPSISNTHDYSDYTSVPVTLQYRDTADFMDLCSADVTTEWFMITNSYHQVSRHVDLMFTPGKFVPVVPFTPATYPFCLKYPYCKEIILLSQRWNPKHKQVVLDMDMLYHTKERNEFCSEWIERNGDNGEDLYAKHEPLRWKLRDENIIGPGGPTGTDYLAYLTREKKDKMYKMTDRSLYGARAPFVKVYRKEEKLDGMSEDELVRRLGMTMLSNQTECSCDRFETEEECLDSGLGCQWRPLFESCHPPEMIDDGVPICSTTEAPTMSPTVSIDRMLTETEAPTSGAEGDSGGEDSEGTSAKDESTSNILVSLFKAREHELDTHVTKDTPVTGDASDGHRHLLVLSDDNSSEGFLNSFDPINVSDNVDSTASSSLMESLSRGEEVGVVPTQSPYQQGSAETMCPTWGPSVVPRRVEELLSPDEDDAEYDGEMETLSQLVNGTAKYNGTTTKKLFIENSKHASSPGKALHTQHQLIQLSPNKALDSSSIMIPSPSEVKRRRILVNYGEQRSPLRIVIETSSLSLLLRQMGRNFLLMEKYNPFRARVNAFIDQIFPSVIDTWGRALEVYPATQNIFPQENLSDMCGEIPIPQEYLDNGVPNTDVVLYVEPRDESICSFDARPRITICHFDQHMRPLIGALSICLSDIDIQSNEVYDKEITRYTALVSQLVGRFLGLAPNLFKYFRDSETGQLWGERKVKVSCKGGDEEELKRDMMLSNIIQQRSVRNEETFYEISTPTVQQVARNHFDCQTLSGARLAAPSIPWLSLLDHDEPDRKSSEYYECSFFNLDLRYHFDEDMTSISQNADAAYGISPVSLALLEDSSWYKANFEAAKTPAFGRGAGCGFVESACISGGNAPDYSKEYFCTSEDRRGARSGCDYTHHNKAGCDLETDVAPPEGRHQYFSDPSFGSPFDDVRYCPMRSKHLVPCSPPNGVKSSVASLAGESFGESSRCFETDAMIPVCLEASCNPKDKTLSVVAKGKTFYCSYYGQLINIDVGYSVKCPRMAAVCPDLVCPSNCSGKGVCDYCKEVPECICDNPFDDSDGCWKS